MREGRGGERRKGEGDEGRSPLTIGGKCCILLSVMF